MKNKLTINVAKKLIFFFISLFGDFQFLGWHHPIVKIENCLGVVVLQTCGIVVILFRSFVHLIFQINLTYYLRESFSALTACSMFRLKSEPDKSQTKHL